MNLCVDVGNSTIAIGIYAENKLVKRLTFTTDLVKTVDEYQNIIYQQVAIKKIDATKIKNIIFSSVVPTLNNPLKKALTSIFTEASLLCINPGIKTGLALRVDNPNEIGNDLIADLVGGKERYGYPLIICDLGTASKILVLDNKGYFTTALIMPGLEASIKTLSSGTALLPEISLEKPKTVLAKNTVEAMNAGTIYGHADMVIGLADRIEKELGYSCKRVITGGNAIPMLDIVKDAYIYDENLNLDGLNLIIQKNGGNYHE